MKRRAARKRTSQNSNGAAKRARARSQSPALPAPSSKALLDTRAVEQFLESLEQKGVTRAKVGGFDIDGVLRGKYISLDKLKSALKSSFGFCDVIFGWDITDALYDNASVTGWDTGYPDVHAVVDRDTLRMIPFEPHVAALLCDFRDKSGNAHAACPRSLLKQVLARANSMGFTTRVGAEYEFFVFQETRDTLTEKGFRDLRPLDPGMFGYSWLRSGQDAELMRDLLDTLGAFDIEIEGLHTETGPGVYEAALRYDEGLRAADKAALFKTIVKQIVHRHGLTATFMAKWNASLPGCSGHLHQSLWQGDNNAFFDGRRAGGMSRVMEHYLAGQMKLMQEFTALYSPTVNSYKRYVPGVWAPLVASWGVENRTCAIRVIGLDDPGAIRVEYRQTAADMNPYIAIAASLGAGLWGIQHELPLPRETKGDPGSDGPLALPRNLRDATRLLAESKAARQVLGDAFVDHYVRTRDWEARAYERAVTNWELERYFELI